MMVEELEERIEMLEEELDKLQDVVDDLEDVVRNMGVNVAQLWETMQYGDDG